MVRTANPYDPPKSQSRHDAEMDTSPHKWVWRSYLCAHFIVVALSAIAFLDWVESEKGAMSQTRLPVGASIAFAAVTFLSLLACPVIDTYLLCRAFKGNSGYRIMGSVDVALTVSHFAMFLAPAVIS